MPLCRLKTPGALLMALIPAACKLSSAPEKTVQAPSERVTWEGRPPLRFLIDSSRSPRLHTLDFPTSDSLRLVLSEYPGEAEAYQAFQARASQEELQQGFYRERNNLHFIHGVFVGELRISRSGLIPASFLKEKLAFRDEELFSRPRAFQGFPIAGQISHSERVLSSDFLGQHGAETVLAKAYRCRGDTALLFRGRPPFTVDPGTWPQAWNGRLDTLKWGREKHFTGTLVDGKPLVFWIFRGGFLGVLGCYDPKLAQEYAEKLKKTTVLWADP